MREKYRSISEVELFTRGGIMRHLVIALIFSGLLLILSANTHAQQASTQSKPSLPRFEIPRIGTIIIDGQVDDWGDTGFRVDALTPIDGKLRPADDYRASLRLAWDDRGLLCLISVDDKHWLESPEIEKLWECDSLELYMAPCRGSIDSCQWVIAPGMTAEQPTARFSFYDNRQSKALAKVSGDINFASAKTKNGCRVEVLLPWTTIGITPRVGREIAFQIMTNDINADGTELYHLSWYPALGAAFTSMKMHRLRLSESCGPAIAARLNLLSNTLEGLTFRALAPAALAGKAVKLTSAGQTLATGVLQIDATGYAQAVLAVAPPTPQQQYDLITLLLENTPVDSLLLQAGQDDFPSRSLALEATAMINKSLFTLSWPLADGDTGTTQISRQTVALPGKKSTVTVIGNRYQDHNFQLGKLYEYSLSHDGPTWPATTYLYAGSAVPLEEQRGTLLLIIEKSIATALHEEITRLTRDLVGDGWKVIRHDVAREDTVTSLKELIVRDCQQDLQVESLFLLGHLPVPYSGKIRPDGHGDHRGAWPADVYYGDIEGAWTDALEAYPEGEGRLKNIAGDGKFDQSSIPGKVELTVGRVDLSDLPAFEKNEVELLRQYLDRDHAYRHKIFTIAPESLINDGFKERSEGFAYGAWQNFITLLGADHVAEGGWFDQGQKNYALMYACGPGSFTSGGGLGSTTELAVKPVNGIFTAIFGSYFADWDTQNNLMRALLGNAGYPLAAFWSGRPHWYLHPLGMGKTIGYCARLTQNNAGEYSPTGEAAGEFILLYWAIRLCVCILFLR